MTFWPKNCWLACTAPTPCPAGTTTLKASSSSTKPSLSTNRRLAARHAPTRRPTPACLRQSVNCLPACQKPNCAATAPAASASTSKAAAAKTVPATASSRSKCTSCRMSTCPAKSAMASATTAKRWKFITKARPSATCWK